jgi:manganese/zinc/iron transport system permease protein
MLGDAISHAVLPGIVLAFLWTGSRSPLPMLLGASSVGLLTTVLVQWLSQRRKMLPDAALGIVFTTLFALGVVLVSRYAGQVDLDMECVLYGEIAYVPWDVWMVEDVSLGPRALWLMSGILLVNLLFMGLCYKELKLCSFDPEYARVLGVRTSFVHYALMTAVALTIVASFELVGAILVIAFVVAPGATAYLLTRRLPIMLGLSVVMGALSAGLGYWLASRLDASIAGCMATVSGVLFAIALIHSRLRARGRIFAR